MHPLQSDKSEAFKMYFAQDPLRCTGRSTIIALNAIASATAKPNTRIYIQDHHGTENADRHTTKLAEEFVKRLGFNYFKFGESVTGCWICLGEPPMGGNRKGVKLKD